MYLLSYVLQMSSYLVYCAEDGEFFVVSSADVVTQSPTDEDSVVVSYESEHYAATIIQEATTSEELTDTLAYVRKLKCSKNVSLKTIRMHVPRIRPQKRCSLRAINVRLINFT